MAPIAIVGVMGWNHMDLAEPELRIGMERNREKRLGDRRYRLEAGMGSRWFKASLPGALGSV